DLRVADEPRLPMRDHGIGKEFQVGIVGERDELCLCRVIGVHGVNLGRRLRGDVRLRARTKRDIERKTVALQQASGRGDQEHAGETRHFRIAIQRALNHIWCAALQVLQDCLLVPPLEAETQETSLTDGAALHLKRLVLKRDQFRQRSAELLRAGPWTGGGGDHADLCTRGSMSKRNSLLISSTSSPIPSPVLQLVNRNGLLPRISPESLCITSRLAPTWGAKSILLMTRMSECVIPGPFLRGILSSSATSIT